MDISRVKFNLDDKVKYKGVEYLLTACILRRRNNADYYQAELTSLVAKRSLVIADLKDVEEI